jgi:hypothetical protein
MILNIYGILIKVKLNRHNRHCRMKNVNCISHNVVSSTPRHEWDSNSQG